jgi:hypothetical protein
VKDADDGLTVLGARIYARQIMETLGETLIDRIVMRTFHLDHLAERREDLAREHFDFEFHCVSEFLTNVAIDHKIDRLRCDMVMSHRQDLREV